MSFAVFRMAQPGLEGGMRPRHPRWVPCIPSASGGGLNKRPILAAARQPRNLGAAHGTCAREKSGEALKSSHEVSKNDDFGEGQTKIVVLP
ncbi:MAG TPA: hypothetical protein VOA64_14910 [Candidatus Dormibacteraeota bacterium]|nr:hypothetical protein [Candidatus Dormibacteraeota bacterium]